MREGTSASTCAQPSYTSRAARSTEYTHNASTHGMPLYSWSNCIDRESRHTTHARSHTHATIHDHNTHSRIDRRKADCCVLHGRPRSLCACPGAHPLASRHRNAHQLSASRNPMPCALGCFQSASRPSWSSSLPSSASASSSARKAIITGPGFEWPIGCESSVVHAYRWVSPAHRKTSVAW